MNKKFFFGLIKEGIGYESGFIRTIVDLYKNPQKVVEASMNNDLTYVNPVKFMVNICSYFIVVNGFIIDWEKVSLQHINRINYLITNQETAGLAELSFAQIMTFIFSTGLIPLLIFTTIVQLYLISKKTIQSTYSFDYHKDVLFYYNGLNVLLYFIFSISAAFLPTDIFLIFYSLYILLFIVGFRKVIELKPIGTYFQNEKIELSRIYKKTMNKAYVILIFCSIILICLIEYLDNLYFGNIFFKNF
jgi:hypothetical protein